MYCTVHTVAVLARRPRPFIQPLSPAPFNHCSVAHLLLLCVWNTHERLPTPVACGGLLVGGVSRGGVHVCIQSVFASRMALSRAKGRPGRGFGPERPSTVRPTCVCGVGAVPSPPHCSPLPSSETSPMAANVPDMTRALSMSARSRRLLAVSTMPILWLLSKLW